MTAQMLDFDHLPREATLSGDFRNWRVLSIAFAWGPREPEPPMVRELRNALLGDAEFKAKYRGTVLTLRADGVSSGISMAPARNEAVIGLKVLNAVGDPA